MKKETKSIDSEKKEDLSFKGLPERAALIGRCKAFAELIVYLKMDITKNLRQELEIVEALKKRLETAPEEDLSQLNRDIELHQKNADVIKAYYKYSL